MEIIVTKNNFESEVINSQIPVIVDFWATWCGPCRMIAPILEDIARENEGSIKVAKINVDEEMELAMRFKIEAIPTLLIFKSGEMVNKSLGLMSKEEILSLVK